MRLNRCLFLMFAMFAAICFSTKAVKADQMQTNGTATCNVGFDILENGNALMWKGQVITGVFCHWYTGEGMDEFDVVATDNGNNSWTFTETITAPGQLPVVNVYNVAWNNPTSGTASFSVPFTVNNTTSPGTLAWRGNELSYVLACHWYTGEGMDEGEIVHPTDHGGGIWTISEHIGSVVNQYDIVTFDP